MNVPMVAPLVFAIAVFIATARAQTTFAEVEPNGQKFEATLVNGMVAGDTITGTSTGSATSMGSSAIDTADTFRVKTAALPFGIYRHTLSLTSGGMTQSGEIIGRPQSMGILLAGETLFQSSSSVGAIQKANVWYGFGKQEQVYYRVNGTVLTTNAYAATLSSTPVAPVLVTGSFVAGNVTVTTVGQGHTNDTEIYVYDSALNPIPLGHNDGLSPNDATVSRVTLNLAAGTYFVALSTYNTANDQSDLNPTEFYDSEALLDFPNVVCNADNFGPSNVGFAVTDGTSTTVVPAVHALPFEIVWASFTVGNAINSYCFGDGSGTACPCGNAGSSSTGCANSVSPGGAGLGGAGTPSMTFDSFVLLGTGMPNSSALYFQGTLRAAAGAGSGFGDGLRCAAGTILRLGAKLNSSGASAYPAGADTPISIRGLNFPGAVREYQVWYRNAAQYCTPSTFNLTSGVEVTWGL